MKKSVIILMALLLTGVFQTAQAATTNREATASAMNRSDRGPRRGHAVRPTEVRHANPRIGTHISKRPHHSTLIRFGGLPYYYAGGVFYRKMMKEYEIVKPEIGMVVPELPDNGVSIIDTNEGIRYEYDGVIYKQIPTRNGLKYEVVGFM